MSVLAFKEILSRSVDRHATLFVRFSCPLSVPRPTAALFRQGLSDHAKAG